MSESSQPPTVSLKRAFGLTTAATLSLAAAGAILALLAGDIGEAGWQVISTSLVISAACLFSMSGAALVDRATGAQRAIGQVTIACALACAAVLLVAVWGDEASSADWFERLVGCLSIATVGLAHISLLLALSRPTDGEFGRRTTGAALFAGVVTTLTAIAPTSGLIDVDSLDDFYWRLLGCEVVLLALTTALSLLARKFFTDDSRPSVSAPTPTRSAKAEVPVELAAHVLKMELRGGGALERWEDEAGSGWVFQVPAGGYLYAGGLVAPLPAERVTDDEVVELSDDLDGDERAARRELIARYRAECIGSIELVWSRAAHYGYAPPR